jgi:RNA polymerase sigma-70 factor (ECF subfamily)
MPNLLKGGFRMATASNSQTSPTLLGRLRQSPNDPVAWEALVNRYGPKILAWCRQGGLQTADAQDITQDVLLKLARTLATFEYDPQRSFRAWLKTLTQHAWSDFVDSRRRARVAGGRLADQCALETLPARDDLVQRLDAAFDQEVLDEAMNRVRLRVKPNTWEAFRLQALEGLSGAQTAGRVDMTVTAVFVARSRVQRLLQLEVDRLNRAE